MKTIISAIILGGLILLGLKSGQSGQQPMMGQSYPANQMLCSDERKICTIVLSNSIESSENYLKMGATIKNLPSDWLVNIELTGNGGDVNTAIYFYNTIEHSQATVKINVVGPVYSAHAMIAMTGKIIEFEEASTFMIHRPAVFNPNTNEYELSSTICSIAKGNDRGQSMFDKCQLMMYYNDKMYMKFFNKKVKPYLTPKELDKYNKGYDVFIDGEEMQRRINKGGY